MDLEDIWPAIPELLDNGMQGIQERAEAHARARETQEKLLKAADDWRG